MQFEGAGDQFVGRTVTGLPPCSPEFALLPPFFEVLDDEAKAMVSVCFPKLPTPKRSIGVFCLASVIHHREWLRANLSPLHPLFKTALFHDDAKLQRLAVNVKCRLSEPSDIVATGIPPHVSLMVGVSKLAAEIRQIVPLIEAVPANVCRGVIQVIDEREMTASTVTRHMRGTQACFQPCSPLPLHDKCSAYL